MLLATLFASLIAFAPALPEPPFEADASQGKSRTSLMLTVRPDSSLAQRLAHGFGQGDADAIMAESASRLDVSVSGEGARYSRAQAAFVLQAFFRDHPPVRARLSTAGVADGARSLLGRYETTGARLFLLDVRLRLRGARWEVAGIRIEQEHHTDGD